uniref:TPR_REGION domain-containing protein n=1 Tax=Caenorhabditis japonica TaxID=281687 RepID=A0A8R1I8D2_CAEJA
MAVVEEIVEGEDEQMQQVENLKKEGNRLFGEGKYEEAREKYKEAFDACPPTSPELQSILLSNTAAALIKLSEWKDAVEAATKAIELGAPNEKALERRAFAYSNIPEKLEDAMEDYKKLQETVPKRNAEFARKVSELDAKINSRNEAMKADMMEKLKSQIGCFRKFSEKNRPKKKTATYRNPSSNCP